MTNAQLDGAVQVGVDSGGTFTDVVAADGSVRKVLSTPEDPAAAVRRGVEAVARDDVRGGPRPERVVHGTTVATNALLERRGARVALYTTEGLADVIEIARQSRPSLFDHWADRPVPLVERELRVEVAERLAADGSVLRPLAPEAVPPVPAGAEAVAVCLLHSVVDDRHERAVAEALAGTGVDVSLSSEVAPEFREYERTVTTVLNAYLRPRTRGYLGRLGDLADQVLVMTSSGGVVPVAQAVELPVHLLLSGPAGGVGAAAAAAVANGFPDAITFDMGGTSTDVCLVLDGRPAPAAQRDVGGLPVRVPSLDIHTIGAGGGSIAWLDDGGALRVGPHSAGADPGPACYGRGGTRVTVTDANLAAGRIDPGAVLGDLGPVDVDAARVALDRLGLSAADVLAVVDAEMTQALRVVSIERGVDPRGLALVAFGGAGPLHACHLADELGLAAVVVPARAGVLSAVGLLGAAVSRERVRAWPGGADHTGLAGAAAVLAGQARADVAAMLGSAGVGSGSGREGSEGDVSGRIHVEVSYDCRYLGQSHEINVESVAAFGAAHRDLNGYDRPGDPVEVVAIRARAVAGGSEAEMRPAPAPIDTAVVGPEVIATGDCTIWVADGWVARPGVGGAIVMTRSGGEGPE